MAAKTQRNPALQKAAVPGPDASEQRFYEKRFAGHEFVSVLDDGKDMLVAWTTDSSLSHALGVLALVDHAQASLGVRIYTESEDDDEGRFVDRDAIDSFMGQNHGLVSASVPFAGGKFVWRPTADVEGFEPTGHAEASIVFAHGVEALDAEVIRSLGTPRVAKLGEQALANLGVTVSRHGTLV